MNNKQRKAMFAKGTIPNNADNALKYCSRCNGVHNSSKAKSQGFFDLPLCNKCNNKGLKPLGHPPHWVWNKMSTIDKQNTLTKVGVPMNNHEPYTTHDININAKKDFDNLSPKLRNKLRHEWGIEKE